MKIQAIFEKLAPRIIHSDLKVKKGEIVLIRVGSHQLNYAAPLYLNICREGAIPFIEIYDDSLFSRRLTEVPTRTLSKVPQFPPSWAKEIDAEILFTFLFQDPELLKKIPAERLGAVQKADRRTKEEFDRKRTRRCVIGFPDQSLRQMLDTDYSDYEKMFWASFQTEPSRLRKIGAPIKKILEKAKTIRVLSANGTDISFNVGDRPIFFHSGDLKPKEYRAGSRVAGLPAGEVFLAPIEDSAEGKAVFEADALTGDGFGKLTLCFQRGKVVKATADKNINFFNNRLRSGSGDKNSIAEFAFGINPALHLIKGKVWDERTPGTIHIAIGNNSLWGGKNDASIHWDFFMVKPTVYADKKLVMKEGELKI
ncbi:MAG: aminopeptidase [Candidatus Omnitrophota bacterium]